MIDEKLLNVIEKYQDERMEDDHSSAISRLLEIGRKKTFVTIDDILNVFPDAEQDVDQLEEAFAALLSAGIPYIDDVTLEEPSDKELESEEDDS
ncbi:MAG: hypothetical protein GWN00_12550, partial [Aliifodinibius sp.]|nr:hypothetical protein [candidate division Zixibacteria bacterium]NIT57023.1 hypothetical protein [Fodinibius sp.]NIV06099.1 hypothetical protein [candidate division Zixibacteria bacterium]NIW39704.1 hypothetical protein [candidate division Zixibacteria bacterium]NIY25606.1 hypothetical protein [Fodinibius sp.]